MKVLAQINSFLYNEFIFAARYRLLRHSVYWALNVVAWALFWMIMGSQESFSRNMFNMAVWIPAFILFSYPLVYFAVPQLLLKGKAWQFFVLILGWGGLGLFLNVLFHNYIYIEVQSWAGFQVTPAKGVQPASYLCMATSAASPIIIRFFKLWTLKQREWLQVQQEKVTAELQLLKAQVHPHFLFNTLNNIYSFSLDHSPKTGELILKLSSLLRYMLHNCNTEKVRLEKEVEVAKDYIDLERERYGSRIEISWNVEGNMTNKYIVPLLLLPFLENAFKHGASEQTEKPWLKINISVNNNRLYCTIANSKNPGTRISSEGIGINNVKKRLEFMYHGKHELSIRNEETMFIVSMMVQLTDALNDGEPVYVSLSEPKYGEYETTVPSY